MSATNDPSPSHSQLNSLIEHYQSGRYEDAEKLAISITQQFPYHSFSWKVLAAVLKQTGRVSEALVANQKAVEIAPEDAEAHSNLGNTLKALGRFKEAEASHRQAIALKPHYAEVHSNLGVTLKALGRFKEAEASYRQAIALKPDFAEAHSNLGNILKDLGRFKEAEASHRQAIALKPDFAEAHSNLGVALKELGRLEEAEASYRQAIALKPDYAEAYLNLCELLEKSNKLDETVLVIKNAIGKVVEKEADFLYYEALILFREENYEIAGRLITKIKEDELTEKIKSSFLKLKGDWHHYKKDYSVAFEAFKAMNKKVKDSSEYKKQAAEKFFNQQREKVFQIEQMQEEFSRKTVIQATWLQPTFLIGFPRSGTTLLDSILRNHSQIHIAEEKPMLEKMESELSDFPKISAIEEIDNAAAEILSGFYFEEFKKHCRLEKNSIAIDKLPLNILQVPLINRIFPQAKFVLALRHPLDCVFSCWMQNFKMNPAMANMVDLDRVVDFYCTAMEILNLCQKRYRLNIHRIRYEDLVLDFRGEVSNTLAFLDLKWEEQLRNYKKAAFAREMINTPSYSQVVKPIYNTASYRWKNYEKYLEPYKKRLAPWLQEYGYLS